MMDQNLDLMEYGEEEFPSSSSIFLCREELAEIWGSTRAFSTMLDLAQASDVTENRNMA